MATTTPDNIYYPTSGENVAPLETVFATQASSVQTALNAARTERNAIDTRLDDLEEKVGPYAMAAGVATFPTTAAGATSSVTVTFPAGRFNVAPVVNVVANSSAPGSRAVGVGARTATSVVLYFTNQGGSGSGLNASWYAVQMTPTTAEG